MVKFGAFVEIIVRDDSGAKIEKRVYKISDKHSAYHIYRWLIEKYGMDIQEVERFLTSKTRYSSDEKGFLDF